MYYFKDRVDAGNQLAKLLVGQHIEHAIVYFLPRGGVVLGDIIASMLNAPLDMIAVRKVGHPNNPEYAMCAIDESGKPICHEGEALAFNKDDIRALLLAEQNEARRRRQVYMNDTPRRSSSTMTAIIVDDGIATGLTMKVAVRAILDDNPKKVIIAVPVTPKDTADKLRKIDQRVEVTAIEEARGFLGAVGSYYQDFPQLKDEEVINILKKYVSH